MSERVEHLIKTAVIAAAEYEAEYLFSLPACEVEISEAAKKKILSYANKKPRARIAPRRLIAILIAAALIAALSITAYAFREQIGNFFVSVFDDHSDFSHSNSDSEPTITRIGEVYIPTEYQKTVDKSTEFQVLQIWENGSTAIQLSYHSCKNGSVKIDTEGSQISEMLIDQRIVYRTNKNGFANFVWEDGKNVYTLTCPEELGQAEFEKIIRSIAPVEG